MKKPRPRSELRGAGLEGRFCNLELVGGRGSYDRSNNSGRDGSEDKVTVDLTPFITPGWLPQVIGPVVDVLTAIPVVVVEVVTLLPLLMTDILLVIVIVVILSNRRDRGAADSKKDCRCKRLFEQVRFLQRIWTKRSPRTLSRGQPDSPGFKNPFGESPSRPELCIKAAKSAP